MIKTIFLSIILILVFIFVFVSINKTNMHMHNIIPSLYLGSLDACRDKKMLKELGITDVINLSCMDCYREPYSKVSYVNINILDLPTEDIKKYFIPCIRYIDDVINSGGKVLVNCYAGISRSSSIVIAYLIYKMRMDPVSAYNFVKRKRNIINPNFGFYKQLIEFHKEINIF